MKQESPEEYILRRKDQLNKKTVRYETDEDLTMELFGLNQSFKEVSFEEQDTIQEKMGETTLTFSCKNPGFKSLSVLELRAIAEKAGAGQSFTEEERRALILFNGLESGGIPFEDVREVESFVLEKGEKRVDIKTIDPKLRIFFSVSNTVITMDSMYDRITDSVFILGVNIFSRLGMMVLLHELGHVMDSQKDIEGIKSLGQAIHRVNTGTGTNDDAAFILERERLAWANGKKEFKPFLKDMGLSKDTLDMLSEYSLQTYLKTVSDVIVENFHKEKNKNRFRKINID